MKLELTKDDLRRVLSKWAETNFTTVGKVSDVTIESYGSKVTVEFEEPSETEDAHS